MKAFSPVVVGFVRFSCRWFQFDSLAKIGFGPSVLLHSKVVSAPLKVESRLWCVLDRQGYFRHSLIEVLPLRMIDGTVGTDDSQKLLIRCRINGSEFQCRFEIADGRVEFPK